METTDFLNFDNIKTEHILMLEEKLTEIVAKEYGTACAYVKVDEIELSYLTREDPTDKPLITIHLRYGVAGENDWQKEMELFYEIGDLMFISGQFYQAFISGE